MKKSSAALAMAALVANTALSMEKTERLGYYLSSLPQELRQQIVSLSLESKIAEQYRAFKKIAVGSVIKSVAFSPDGKTALTGSWDNTARLWDVDTGKELQQFVGHAGAVSSVAFSSDGKTVLTWAEDETARWWDVATGQELRRLTGHTHLIFSVAFSPDGKTILTGSCDKTARLWDIETGQELRKLTEHKNDVTSVAFSPDGKIVLTGSLQEFDKKLKILIRKAI